MPKQMTILECVADIMNFSRHGALAHAFVMDALSRHAGRIAGMSHGELRQQFGAHPMISAEAWHAVASEIHKKLEAHFRQ